MTSHVSSQLWSSPAPSIPSPVEKSSAPATSVVVRSPEEADNILRLLAALDGPVELVFAEESDRRRTPEVISELRPVGDGALVVREPGGHRHGRLGALVEASVDGVDGGAADAVQNGTHPVAPTLMTAARVSVVVPTMNEARNVGWVLDRLPEGLHEVILVDGRSTDDTVAVARAVVPDIRVVLERRPGKGAALRAGFDAARGDYVVMIDADGSMDPLEIPHFVAALDSGCDFVKGTRFARGGGTSDMELLRRVGNGALRTAVNALYRTRFSDLCYGFIAFRRDKLSALRLASDGFEIETEMVVRAVLAGLRIGEVPSFEAERLSGESHLQTWSDGRRVLRRLLAERVLLPPTPVVVPQVAT